MARVPARDEVREAEYRDCVKAIADEFSEEVKRGTFQTAGEAERWLTECIESSEYTFKPARAWHCVLSGDRRLETGSDLLTQARGTMYSDVQETLENMGIDPSNPFPAEEETEE